MTGSLDLSNNEMPKASAAPTGSLDEETQAEQWANKKALIELSNDSVLHGYDMAMDVLKLNNQEEAVQLLLQYRPMIQLGLDKNVQELNY